MPIHDWSRVQAGIFHDFHHAWVEELKRALNRLLPSDYYALAEQYASQYGPDVLTLQGFGDDANQAIETASTNGTEESTTALLAPPTIAVTAQTDMEFYRQKQKIIVVRHASDDRVVAVVEVVSRANKSSRVGIDQFKQKAAWLIEQNIHLLILDLQPRGSRDPNGIHGVVWKYITGDETYRAPAEKPLTLVAYEAGLTKQAYVVPMAVGDTLPDMPVFLKVDGQIPSPLEETYQRAFDFMPRRWRTVLETT